MKIFGWFDVGAVEIFANSVSLRLIDLSRRSPTAIGRGEKKVRKVLDGFDAVLIEVEEFAKNNRMNIYKKARFLNVIKWTLEESDCSKDFISKAISALSVSINKR